MLVSDSSLKGGIQSAAVTEAARLFYRLIGRPMAREPLRTGLTILCVAIGVAVVVAIDLAGEASAGSFRSSMESMQGSASYEISQVGGIPDSAFGRLSRLREPLRFAARVEGYATWVVTGERVPIFGVDLIGDEGLRGRIEPGVPNLEALLDSRPVWVSAVLGASEGDRIDLAVNGTHEEFIVGGVLRDPAGRSGPLGAVVLMDIALAQQVLGRAGFLDRIYVETLGAGQERDWEPTIREALPAAAELEAVGVRSRQNRKLLNSFRWNLQILSYIALIVGAFLVYNTVSASVVRRRHWIGVARALGMTRGAIRLGFLAEGLFFGLTGSVLGLALGRAMAAGAVELMGRTVQSLYVSSAPSSIEVGLSTAAVAGLAGIGVSIFSAWWPASEAAAVAPAVALGKAHLDYRRRVEQGSWSTRGLACAGVSSALCLVPAWDRVPFAAYAACLGLVAAATMLVPRACESAIRAASRPLLRLFGAAALLGARTLSGSLARTSVIVASLSTATAMMVSVAIMVGSMRDTLLIWMDSQLQADLYVQPEGRPGEESAPTMSNAVAAIIEALPQVEAVDRFRRYAISYGGLPATLALADLEVARAQSGIRFLGGRDLGDLADRLLSTDSVIVSEPFSSKHGVQEGDTVTLPVGDGEVDFDVAGVYYDYSSERGLVVGHRDVLMRYLPDDRPSSLAVYLERRADPEEARALVVRAIGSSELQVSRTRELREGATEVFDRTFAITYALEAVAVFVAILGMAGALLTLVIDRRSELGVLRVLGASKGQVRGLVLAQAGLLGIVSTAIGLALGCALSVVLVKVINKQSFGWTIQFHWPVALLLAALGAVLAASMAAGCYPALVASARDPREIIREE